MNEKFQRVNWIFQALSMREQSGAITSPNQLGEYTFTGQDRTDLKNELIKLLCEEDDGGSSTT